MKEPKPPRYWILEDHHTDADSVILVYSHNAKSSPIAIEVSCNTAALGNPGVEPVLWIEPLIQDYRDWERWHLDMGWYANLVTGKQEPFIRTTPQLDKVMLRIIEHAKWFIFCSKS